MGNNSFTYRMIRGVVDRKIRDIRANPRSGIRGLLELARFIPGGSFQKFFFEMARQQLEDENSPYYQLIERVVLETDPDQLSAFGINLGYRAMAKSAKEAKKADGSFSGLWALVLGGGDAPAPCPARLRQTVAQGRKRHVYAYAVFTKEQDPLALLPETARAEECAFVLLLPPKAATPELAREAVKAGNVFVGVDLDAEGADRAARVLAGSQCLRGGFSAAPPEGEALQRASQMKLPFYLYVRPEGPKVPEMDNVYRRMAQTRMRLPAPVFPVDLFADIGYIGRAMR